MFLDIVPGELFALLGHNGAGKTTLINILTGNILSTEGYAVINGNVNDMLLISSKDIGLCPQHDILWDELTAEEHIEIYAKLRGDHIK